MVLYFVLASLGTVAYMINFAFAVSLLLVDLHRAQ